MATNNHSEDCTNSNLCVNQTINQKMAADRHSKDKTNNNISVSKSMPINVRLRPAAY